MQLNHPHNRGGYRLRVSNKLQPPPKENFSVSIISQVSPVGTHKSAKLARLRSSRGCAADEWCEAPETISKHCVPPENSLCKQRTKPVLGPAPIILVAKPGRTMGKAGRELGGQSKETVAMLSCTAAWVDGGTVARVVVGLRMGASWPL